MENQLNITNFLYINRPTVSNDTVYFQWHMDLGIDKSVDNLYVTYDELDISHVPLQIHYNTILGLILNKLRGIAYSTVIVTEDPINKNMAKFWCEYHKLDNVFFSNLTQEDIPKYIGTQQKRTVGILYGGGKDSYFALDSLYENSNIDRISLISFVIPDAHVNIKQLEERRDNLILSPISNQYDVDIIKIKTNARSSIQGYHLELYFAPLGVLIWLNLFNYITFSYEYCHYFIPDENNHNFGFERSQISYMNKISSYYSNEIASIPLSIFNANQHLSELSSFGYLAKKNKTFYKTLLMCESTVDVNTKWCCSCTKCAEFVLFSMYYDIEQKDINLDYFFKESGWIQKVMLNINNKNRGSFFTGLTSHLHFDSFRFVLNKLSNKVENYLTDPIAIENFHKLSNFFGETTILNEDAFYFDVLKSTYPVELYNESYRQLKAILPSSLASPRKSIGNIKRNFDLNIQPQIPDLVDISVDNHQLSSLLVQNYKRTSHLNSSPTEGIIKSYQLASLGSLKNEYIQHSYNRNFFDISINQNPLKRGDGYKLDLVIPIFHSNQYCAFMIKVPHFQKALEDRFEAICSVNQYAALLSLSQARDNIVYFSLTEQNRKELKVVISIELKAKYNLEPWKWGNAARLILDSFKFYEKEQNLFFKNKNIIEIKDDKNIVKPLKIFIAGSCVSRDPFGDNSNDKLRYVGYFARYSLARISYPSIKNRVLTEQEFCQKISSPFQRKILQQEWDNSLLDRIQQTEFDFLVVDCIDERFGLVEYSQGIYITNSDELKNAKIFDIKNAPKLQPNSQDFFDKWEEGFKSVVNAVGAEKIIINNVFWSNRLDTGEVFNLERVKEDNAILSKLYLIARKYIPDNQFVNYPDNMFIGDSNHKWGKSPFHYKQEVYDYFTDFLSKLK